MQSHWRDGTHCSFNPSSDRKLTAWCSHLSYLKLQANKRTQLAWCACHWTVGENPQKYHWQEIEPECYRMLYDVSVQKDWQRGCITISRSEGLMSILSLTLFKEVPVKEDLEVENQNPLKCLLVSHLYPLGFVFKWVQLCNPRSLQVFSLFSWFYDSQPARGGQRRLNPSSDDLDICD